MNTTTSWRYNSTDEYLSICDMSGHVWSRHISKADYKRLMDTIASCDNKYSPLWANEFASDLINGEIIKYGMKMAIFVDSHLICVGKENDIIHFLDLSLMFPVIHLCINTETLNI